MKFGVKIPHGGKCKGKIEIRARVMSPVGNLQRSIEKFQLSAFFIFFLTHDAAGYTVTSVTDRSWLSSGPV